MAKGKGKGKGKGRKSEEKEGNCCGCICCCLLLPPILLIIGVIFLMTGNDRVERIEAYNERAKKWVEEGMEAFRGAKFSIDGQELEMDTTTSGKYYPVRDSCNKEDDPAEKCVYTEALYYKAYIPLSTNSTTTAVTIMSGEDNLVSKEFNNDYSKVYTPSDLDCDDEKSKCSSECHSKGGTWNSVNERCTVAYYLNSICYRVAKTGDKYRLDIPPLWHLSFEDAGCDYSNDYRPAMYSTGSRVSSIPVFVRYYQDSYLSASEMTYGCSSTTKSTSSSCFGMSRKEQDKVGYSLAGVGLFLFVVEIGLLIAMCVCCKEIILSLFGKKKKKALLKADANAIPVAQPGYMPAQPAMTAMPPYVPAQPSYMPAQSAQPAMSQYMPPQPGYAPYNMQQY